MKISKAVYRSIVIIIIAILSIASGIVFQLIYNSIQRTNYPKQYDKFVEKYSYEYGIPEYVIYSVMKVESDFESGAVSSAGAVGLMQMMPDTFNYLTAKKQENLSAAMLYDPETNINYGTYYLKLLYVKYGSWTEVYAAYNAGETVVDGWLKDKTLVDRNGKLEKIPYGETEDYVEKLKNANDIYKKLYYQE